VVLIFH